MSWRPPIVGGRATSYQERQGARVYNAIPVNSSMVDFGRGAFRQALGAVSETGPVEDAGTKALALFGVGVLVGAFLGFAVGSRIPSRKRWA